MEVTTKFLIENPSSDLKQQMSAFGAPSHLLFFNHSFTDDVLHGRFYKCTYAFGESLQKTPEVGEQIAWITYITIVASIILHGTSATPLMNWYKRKFGGKKLEEEPSSAQG